MIERVLWDERTNEVAREGVGPAVPAFEYLTHLGDGAVLLVAGILIYWFGTGETRRNRAFVIAVGTAALALSAGLKGIVELARPELVFAPTRYPGYSFPSAHAMGSAAFYGALAVTERRGSPRIRYLLAGLVIAVVSLSRVVIGVHYLGDVVVGSLLGLSLVAIGLWLREEGVFDPGPLFVLAAIIAGVTATLGSRVFLTLTLGAAIGGAIGWYAVRDRRTTDSGAAVLVLGGSLLLGIVVLRGVSVQFGVGNPVGMFDSVWFVLEVLGYAALTMAVLAVPVVAIRIEQWPTIRWLQSVLPFRGRVVEFGTDDGQSDGKRR